MHLRLQSCTLVMHLLNPVSVFPDSILIEYRIAYLYMGIVYKRVAHPIWDYSWINLYFGHFTNKFYLNLEGALQTQAQARLSVCVTIRGHTIRVAQQASRMP